jgi:hypothetical protein
MRKNPLILTTIILMAVMLWSMTACSTPPEDDERGAEGSEGSGSTTDTSEEPVDEPPVTTATTPPLIDVPPEEIPNITLEQTKMYEAFQILEQGDNFTLAVNLTVYQKTLYRRGNDWKAVIATFPVAFVRGGNTYRYDYPGRTAWYSPATEKDYAEVFENFDFYHEVVEWQGAVLQEVGFANFRNYSNLYFEEFIDRNGDLLRAFFNRQGELFGLELNLEGSGQIVTIGYHISPNVDDDVFSFPYGWETRPASESGR